MAKSKKYYSTPEQLIANVKSWLNSNRPLTNEEMVLYLDDKYGTSLVKLLARKDYVAKVLVMGNDGEYETLVSLPRAQVANNKI